MNCGYTKYSRKYLKSTNISKICGKITTKGDTCKVFPTYKTDNEVWCCGNHIKQHVYVSDCPICIQGCDSSNSVLTVCKHRFHLECIRNWLVQDNNTCPMCRTRFQITCLDDDTEAVDIRTLETPKSVYPVLGTLDEIYERMQVFLSPIQIEETFNAYSNRQLIYFPMTLREYYVRDWLSDNNGL